MSASAIITLDTTAPSIELGTAYRSGESLIIPYEVNEDSVIEAIASSPGVGDLEVLVTPTEIQVNSVPDGAAVIDFEITATDDVLNSSSLVETIEAIAIDFTLPLMLTIEPTVTRTLELELAQRELTFERNPRELTFEFNRRELALVPTILRSLAVSPTALRSLSVSATPTRTLAIEPTVARSLTIDEE